MLKKIIAGLFLLLFVYVGLMLWGLSRLREVHNTFSAVSPGTIFTELPYTRVLEPQNISCIPLPDETIVIFSSLSDFKDRFPSVAKNCESVNLVYRTPFIFKRAMIRLKFDKELKLEKKL